MAVRIRGKRPSTLARERVLIEHMKPTDRAMPLHELVHVVQAHEPQINDAALTAHLDRLVKEGIVERPRKGYYAKTPASESYLLAITDEIAAR